MPRSRPALFACALTLAVAAPAAVAAPRPAQGPQVRGAWARPTMGAAGMSAIYLEVVGSRRPDALVGASTPAAGSLELHRSEMHDGMMGMAAASDIPIPPGAVVRLAPGGLHLMLMDARRPLRAGDRIPVTLRFAKAAPVTVEAEVRSTPPGR